MSKRKSGHICAVETCRFKRYNSDKSFFRFPKDPERSRTWVIACHREDLLENLDRLYDSHRLCEDHFERKMFNNESRNRLKINAVPTLFPGLEGSSEHIYSRLPLVKTDEESPSKKIQNIFISPASPKGFSLTKREIFMLVKDKLNCEMEEVYKGIEKFLSTKYQTCVTLPSEEKESLGILMNEFRIRWNKSQNLETLFFQYNEDWLNKLHFFSECSDNSKQIQTPELQMGFRAAGHIEGVAVRTFNAAPSSKVSTENKPLTYYKPVSAYHLVSDATTQTGWMKEYLEDKSCQTPLYLSQNGSGEKGKKRKITLPEVLRFIEENCPKSTTDLVRSHFSNVKKNTKGTRKKLAKCASQNPTEHQSASFELEDATSTIQNINSSSIAEISPMETEEIKIEYEDLINYEEIKIEKDDPEYLDHQDIHGTLEKISDDLVLEEIKEEIKTECIGDDSMSRQELDIVIKEESRNN